MGNARKQGTKQLDSGIRPASESSIEIDFYYRHVRCRERIKKPPTPRNLNYAAKLKARIEHEIVTGEFDYRKHFPDSPRARAFSALPGDDLTLESYLKDWLQLEKQNTKPSTWDGYRKIVNGHLIPSFGKLMLTEFKRKHVIDWLTQNPDITRKTVNNILSPLRIALNVAIDREVISVNPLIGYELRRRDKTDDREEVDPFSTEERAAILAQLEGQNYNLVQFAFWTGLRTSELIALDWPDIDLTRGVAVITKTFTKGMVTPEKSTKTRAGRREVKLLKPALEALEAQKQFTFLKNAEVFQNPRTGERWTGHQAIRRTMWGYALKRGGVRYRKPYQTRHSYASMMLTAGENVMWVAQQMGHTDWSLTAKRYARWIPADMPNAGEKAVKMFSFGQHSVSVNQ